jgi:hypothetical protein
MMYAHVDSRAYKGCLVFMYYTTARKLAANLKKSCIAVESK